MNPKYLRKILFTLLLFSCGFSFPQKTEGDVMFLDEMLIDEEENISKQKTEVLSYKLPKKENVDVILSSSHYKIGEMLDEVFWFEEKIGAKREAKGIIKKGRILLPNVFNKGEGNLFVTDQGHVVLSLAGKVGVYNVISEKWIIPLEYEGLHFNSSPFYLLKKGGKYGIVDTSNFVVEDFKWDKIERISGLPNYFIVKRHSKGYGYKEGVCNVLIKALVLPCEYDKVVKIYLKNLFIVKKNDLYNVVNVKNEFLFKDWYKELEYVNDGSECFIVEKDRRMGVLDMNGKQIIPVTYKLIDTRRFSNGVYFAQNKEGKFGCMKIDGTIVLPFIYENINRNDKHGNMVCIKDGKLGLIRMIYGVPHVLTTCDYDKIDAQNRVYIVSKKGKSGILNMLGQLLTDLDYDDITYLKGNGYSALSLFVADEDGKKLLLSESGRVITTSKYEEIKMIPNSVKSSSNESFSYLKYKKGKKYGLLNASGEVITKPVFEEVLGRWNNILTIERNGKLGLYDVIKRKGIVSADYDTITPVDNVFVGGKGSNFFRITIKDSGVEITEY